MKIQISLAGRVQVCMYRIYIIIYYNYLLLSNL